MLLPLGQCFDVPRKKLSKKEKDEIADIRVYLSLGKDEPLAKTQMPIWDVPVVEDEDLASGDEDETKNKKLKSSGSEGEVLRKVSRIPFRPVICVHRNNCMRSCLIHKWSMHALPHIQTQRSQTVQSSYPGMSQSHSVQSCESSSSV